MSPFQARAYTRVKVRSIYSLSQSMELEQQVLEQEAQNPEPACAEQEQPSVANPNLVPATRRHSIASGMIPLLAATYSEAPHGQPSLNPEFAVPS